MKFLATHHTPGRAKALRALGAAKRRNRVRIQAGKAPIIGGKSVSSKMFARMTSTTVKSVARGSAPGKSQRMTKRAVVRKWGKKAL